MDKITHEVRLAQWAEVVRQCQTRPAGMSANTWLKENGIAVKNYYYWQRRVRNEVYKGVGRNEMCPCGSGKKYKYCCEKGFSRIEISNVRPMNLFYFE